MSATGIRRRSVLQFWSANTTSPPLGESMIPKNRRRQAESQTIDAIADGQNQEQPTQTCNFI